MEVSEINEDSSVVHMREELARLTRTVPPAYQQWGAVRTGEFKKAAKDATDALASGLMVKHLVWKRLKLLRTFW